MKIKASKDPRRELSFIWGLLAAISLLQVGLSLFIDHSPVWAALQAAIGVLFFFYWRAERAQLKVDRREVRIAAASTQFARHQPDDISHGEARRQLIEFIKTQRTAAEREPHQPEKQRAGVDE